MNNNTVNENYSAKELQKMIFIYNALDDGWTVRKINSHKYELLKDNEEKKEIILEDCIVKYIKDDVKEEKKK
jgi:adenosyl cobinamide kinase/adenosyl cobinamide phosphate guanylyltransferase